MPLWDYGERARAVSSNSFVKARFTFAVSQAKPPNNHLHMAARKRSGLPASLPLINVV